MADGGLHTALVRLRRAVGTSGERAEDTILLSRFAANRDAAAFEHLVVRHGPMVRAVCRRVLRHEQDAEDAFQATFLALARSAGGVGRGSVAGWLYRTAFHTGLKAKARALRRRETPAPEDFTADGDPAAAIERTEMVGMIDAEVTRLPERLRLPVILCYFEGRSNSEAATELGCPRGTVDSRLAAARSKLELRLIGRGVAPATAAALLDRLAAGEAVGAALPASAIRTVVAGAVAFTSCSSGAGGVISPAAAGLAHEVLHMVFVSKLKWAAFMTLALGLLGAGGASTYQALAGDGSGEARASGAEKDEPKEEGRLEVAKATARKTAGDVRKLLKGPAGLERPIEEMTLRDALGMLSDKFEVTIRIDPAAFLRYKVEKPFKLYEQPVTVPVVRELTLGDVLRDLLAQVGPEAAAEGLPPLCRVTYLVKGSQIAIVPQYQTPFPRPIPGGDDVVPFLSQDMIEEQLLGEIVAIDYQQVPLVEVLRDLADQTGANIVLDGRAKDKSQTLVTLTLQQVRLFKALQVIADMADLQPVALHNVYYVTAPENAKKLERREFGHPPEQPQPRPGVGPSGPGLGDGGTISPAGVGVSTAPPAGPAKP